MKRIAFSVLLLGAGALFMWLGFWQLDRLAWKRELIARTEARLQAEPVALPAPEIWGDIGSDAAYTRVRAVGIYDSGQDTFVVASTRYGRGFWVMTPLRTVDGFRVLVNRGFVNSVQKESLTEVSGTVVVDGLLRMSEPEGSLLQANRPAEDRWFSRDVNAIGVRRGLKDMAPFFVDAAANGAVPPIGGLTVVQFRNNHLQYALTWFGLALMMGVGLVYLLWDARRK